MRRTSLVLLGLAAAATALTGCSQSGSGQTTSAPSSAVAPTSAPETSAPQTSAPETSDGPTEQASSAPTPGDDDSESDDDATDDGIGSGTFSLTLGGAAVDTTGYQVVCTKTGTPNEITIAAAPPSGEIFGLVVNTETKTARIGGLHKEVAYSAESMPVEIDDKTYTMSGPGKKVDKNGISDTEIKIVATCD